MSELEPKAEIKPAKVDRILVLQGQIEDLKKRLPKHSTPPAMLQQLEYLEEELEKLLAKQP